MPACLNLEEIKSVMEITELSPGLLPACGFWLADLSSDPSSDLSCGLETLSMPCCFSWGI